MWPRQSAGLTKVASDPCRQSDRLVTSAGRVQVIFHELDPATVPAKGDSRGLRHHPELLQGRQLCPGLPGRLHPAGGGAGEFTGTEMLYIDPVACIDCGACLEECPVDAIYYDEDLPEELERFRDINAAYFERHPLEPDSQPVPGDYKGVEPGSLRVAIVGAGPAACYLAGELIHTEGVE